MEIHGFETLLIVQRISYKQGARVQSGGTRATAGTVYPILGYGCAGCQRLYHSLVPTYILGLVYCHPWPENLGWREQGLGLRSSLESQGARARPGSGPGSMADVPKLKEMANPRAGSEAKARSMAMLVTTLEVRASTLAHSQELKGVG